MIHNFLCSPHLVEWLLFPPVSTIVEQELLVTAKEMVLK